MANTFKFKTNINCGGCVAKVTPVLNKSEIVKSWSVDTNSPEKFLTAEIEGENAERVVSLLQGIGYKAEKVD